MYTVATGQNVIPKEKKVEGSLQKEIERLSSRIKQIEKVLPQAKLTIERKKL